MKSALALGKEKITDLTLGQMHYVLGGELGTGTSSTQPPPEPPQPKLSCKNNETNICGATSLQISG